jgi:hypothetical protein
MSNAPLLLLYCLVTGGADKDCAAAKIYFLF